MEKEIEALFKKRGVNPTTIRVWVYKELAQTQRPLSLKELEEHMVTAERSTIFRALTLLLQHHLIHGIEDGSGSLKYEICHGHEECTLNDQHAHFYCQTCQRTFCLHHISIPHPELPEGFHAKAVNYMIKGICAECQHKKRNP